MFRGASILSLHMQCTSTAMMVSPLMEGMVKVGNLYRALLDRVAQSFGAEFSQFHQHMDTSYNSSLTVMFCTHSAPLVPWVK